jgi:hypothetical protein
MPQDPNPDPNNDKNAESRSGFALNNGRSASMMMICQLRVQLKQ